MATRRTAKKKSTKRVKKAPARKAAPQRAAKRTAKSKPRKAAKARRPTITGLVVQVPPHLQARLKMLATTMAKSMDDLIAQALDEFTETWEDHARTVAALKEDEARVHLTVPKE